MQPPQDPFSFKRFLKVKEDIAPCGCMYTQLFNFVDFIDGYRSVQPSRINYLVRECSKTALGHSDRVFGKYLHLEQ